MNFFGFQFIIGNSSVTATKKFQNILSSSVIAGGIYGEHLSQNRRIDRNIHLIKRKKTCYFLVEIGQKNPNWWQKDYGGLVRIFYQVHHKSDVCIFLRMKLFGENAT